MRDPGIADAPGRLAFHWLRREVLEDLEVCVAVAKHYVSRRAAVECGDPVRHVGAVSPGLVDHDLEANQVSVELEHPLGVVGRDRDVMQTADHARISLLWLSLRTSRTNARIRRNQPSGSDALYAMLCATC